MGRERTNHKVVVSFQQTELSAVAALEPNPLHSSQPVPSQGSQQCLPEDVSVPSFTLRCERSYKLQGGKDQRGASFPLLDETQLVPSSAALCTSQTAPALH